MLWLMAVATGLQAAPAPIANDFSDTEVLALLPAGFHDTPDTGNPDRLADRIQGHITRARTAGDPRHLGYAMALLEPWPDTAMTDRLRVLRATLNQSLHRFDQARADLDTVRSLSAGGQPYLQATLTLANMELVRGRYGAARDACNDLATRYPGLLAQHCLARVDARTGKAATAYQRLASALLQRPPEDPRLRAWVEGTLGDMAAQQGLVTAVTHWQTVLQLTPDDLYVRAQLADWQLAAGQPAAAVALTNGYDSVDPLAIRRVIALQAGGQPDAARSLTRRLRERFDEALWRGSDLHRRDYARFLLDIDNRPGDALDYAVANWRDQREAADTRLLLRAAQRAGDEEAIRQVRQWLASVNQSDRRFDLPPSGAPLP